MPKCLSSYTVEEGVSWGTLYVCAVEVKTFDRFSPNSVQTLDKAWTSLLVKIIYVYLPPFDEGKGAPSTIMGFEVLRCTFGEIPNFPIATVEQICTVHIC